MRLFSWLAIKDILEGGGGVVPTGNIDITDTQVTDVSAYATAQVVDADLVAENIKKDVNILGVVGSYEGGGGGGDSYEVVFKKSSLGQSISFDVKGEPKAFVMWNQGTVRPYNDMAYYVNASYNGNSTQIYLAKDMSKTAYDLYCASFDASWTYQDGVLTITAGPAAESMSGRYYGLYYLLYVY